MSRKRSIRFRGQKHKQNVTEIDITSLLDVLVILIVFLLTSYNTSSIVINVPKEISLPKSASNKINNPGIVVQVSPSQILVDDKEVLNSNLPPLHLFDEGERRIIPLYNALIAKKEEIQLLSKSVDKAQEFTGNVNLVIDKSIKYSFVKKLLYTCAQAGFKQYKFVVLGTETL